MVTNESAGLPASDAGPFHTDLEEDAIGLLGATMQAITHIAPAIAGFFFTAFIVSLAGITAPLAYFIGFLVVLMLGSPWPSCRSTCPRPVATTPTSAGRSTRGSAS